MTYSRTLVASQYSRRQFHTIHTIACIVGDPVPPTPLDDVYNRDALAGRACPQPLPSSLDVRRGRRHLSAVLRCGVCCATAYPLTFLQ